MSPAKLIIQQLLWERCVRVCLRAYVRAWPDETNPQIIYYCVVFIIMSSVCVCARLSYVVSISIRTCV